MLTIHGSHGSGRPMCDGATRRQFLAIGGLSFGMGGLSLANLLRAEETTAKETGSRPRHKALINIFLAGGPPHQDMWDLKPDAKDSPVNGTSATVFRLMSDS